MMKIDVKQGRISRLFSRLALFLSVAAAFSAAAAGQDYERIMKGVATDIAALKGRYPQLADFSVKEHLNLRNLTISYDYHTHEPAGRPGWAGSVPNPDSDGVWFHIDLHDPASMAQIHTQPRTARLCAGDKRATFLILEGEKTRSLANDISRILKRHGITPCPR